MREPAVSIVICDDPEAYAVVPGWAYCPRCDRTVRTAESGACIPCLSRPAPRLPREDYLGLDGGVRVYPAPWPGLYGPGIPTRGFWELLARAARWLCAIFKGDLT